jgi:coenzyme F420 hydrogenase subunit beta
VSTVKDIQDVVEKHLCCGCGACAWFDEKNIRMVDVLEQGRRPLVTGEREATAGALEVCPGWRLEHDPKGFAADVMPELLGAWGPILEVWEGYAADEEIRYFGSSGGVGTALAVHCIEKEGMRGAVHIAARPDVPYLNHTVFSRSRDELLQAAGSRYAPASPCEGLGEIERAGGPCVFIGKPCDVGATQRARRLRPDLDRNLGLTIGIFCAGTPSTLGTLKMLQLMRIEDPASVKSVRYRGKGWPGNAEAVAELPEGRVERSLTYREAWDDVLQKHRQWRCYVCLDHTGEFADISVGDPWYRPIAEGEAGRSLVLVRTERGRDILRRAMERGSVVLERVDKSVVAASQPNLLETRGAVWGRALICRIFARGSPRYRNMGSFSIWLRHLSFDAKLRSLLGTIKRVWRKRLYARARIEVFDPVASQHEPCGTVADARGCESIK